MSSDILQKLKDFRVFLTLVWRFRRLPDPTPLQLDIANTLQNSDDRLLIEAFRGVGKSDITDTFVLWKLFLDRSLQIGIISASAEKAKMATTYCLNLMAAMPLLQSMRPSLNQRSSTDGFDVAGCPPSPTPNMWARGIGGQITGLRADILIADDVEVSNNSGTFDQREKLYNATREFDAILKTGFKSKIIYLGTPQNEDTIYNKIVNEREYFIRIYPALIPDEKHVQYYGNKLAPYVKELSKTREVGLSTDPEHFSDDDLKKKQIGDLGFFELQYMLNTNLYDGQKTPLKLHDLIVTDIHESQAPIGGYEWTNDREFITDKEVPCVGLAGDRFYKPRRTVGVVDGSSDPIYGSFSGTIMAIDPAGSGSVDSDETAYCITKCLNGFIYLVDVGGIFGNSQLEMNILADKAKEWNVSKIVVERYGGGVYTEALKPVIYAKHKCAIEEVKAGGQQKELRIIDRLIPILGRHKVIVSPIVIKNDYNSIRTRSVNSDLCYSLFYQIARLTKDRGSLRHDDRIDAFAMACFAWINHLSIDANKSEELLKKQLREKQMKLFMKSVKRFEKKQERFPLFKNLK